MKELPFYCLSESELGSYLRTEKLNIITEHSILREYLSDISNRNLLEELNFSYVTETQFNKRVRNLTNYVELAVFHLNIRSLNCNHRALCQFLQLLEIDFDVIILSEIWSTNIEFYCNILQGYSFHYQLPHESHIGGIGMFIKNNIDYKELSDYKLTKLPLGSIEDVWFEMNKNKKKNIVGGIYRHPNQSIENFVQQMDIVLGEISRTEISLYYCR